MDGAHEGRLCALQEHRKARRYGPAGGQRVNEKEKKSNKVTSLSSSSTNIEYPSAKAVYDAIYNQYLDEFNKEKQAVIDKHEAELKTKISFYGDSILIGVFNDLHENFPDAKFITDKDFNFESLKAELAKEIAEKTINYNVVLAFDSLVDLGSLSKEKYQELLELCKDQKIYVVKTVENLEVPEEISIIDFYQILKDNPEYTVRDSAYLTDEGNKALNKLLNEYFNPVEEVEEN